MSPPPASSGSDDPERAWRQSFDAFERMIGKPLEEFMQSEEFADAAAEYLKRHGDTRSEMQKGSQAWLQMWNMASASDVAELRRELDETRKRLDALEARLGTEAG
jgi:hypothetical protein